VVPLKANKNIKFVLLVKRHIIVHRIVRRQIGKINIKQSARN